jgi:hypothetical protein
MIEVFKTDVSERCQANLILERLHLVFADYIANFDLEDCDRILRVKSKTGNIQTSCLIDLLKSFGYRAEVLQDH